MEGFEKLLWDTLDKIIGSREQVYIRQRRYCIDDMILNYCRYESLNKISSGSKAEGLSLAGSDEDVMYVKTNINISSKLSSQTLFSDLIMETNNVKPGFAKLVLGFDKRSIGKLGIFASALTPVGNNRVYLSSLLFRDKLVDITRETRNAEPHGPCATYTIDSILEFDNMFCLRYRNWPYEANEWVQRRRIYNWPTQDLVRKIADEGCLLVPIGNPLSEESHIEWRISFSLAEKKLVHSMNHTQILCYGLLKLYLKHVIDAREDCKGLLCSYFLKTSLFYCIEEDDIVWDQHNIVNCFWCCFKRLFLWIKQGYFPNYFVKSNNMIENKVVGENQHRLIEHLHNLYTTGANTLMQIPVIAESLGHLMTRTLKDVSIEKINECRCDKELHKMSLSPIPDGLERIVSIVKLHQMILSLQHVSSIDKVCLKLCFVNYYVYLTNHLYQTIVRSSSSNSTKYKQLNQLSGYILRYCTGHDICTGLLQCASLHFLTGRYSKAVCILENVLTKFKCFVLYVGSTDIFYGNAHQYINHMCGKGFTIEHKMKSALARAYLCVLSCALYPPEIEIEVMRYQETFCDATFIPPKVYCYVLLFLTHHRTGNIEFRNQTLDKLCEATEDDLFINETEKPLVSALLSRCVNIASPTL